MLLFTTPFIKNVNSFSITSKRSSFSSSSLYGYLDDLSPKPKGPSASQQPKPKGGGIIPSGRPGGRGSYLEEMTAGSLSSFSNTNATTTTVTTATKPKPTQEDEHPSPKSHDIVKTKRSVSGGTGYLTTFLDTKDDTRTDVRNLLTQRSIQSFMYLCETCHDPHTTKWIQEDFLNTGNLLDYHGTGAAFLEEYGGSWDASLLAMTQQEKTSLTISTRQSGGGSKNNPYLQDRWVEMTVDIDPTNLVTRILSVREQIGKEWVQDLDILVKANNQILESFFEVTKEARENDANASGEAIVPLQDSNDVNKNRVFDRKAALLLSEYTRDSVTMSSPIRRSNFDLLYNLCTQAAIHRILREKKVNQKDPSFVFLRDYYGERAGEYFDGHLDLGRADDFMEDLLLTAPSVNQNGGITDPLFVAGLIIKMRKKVAKDWKDLMESVPEDHTGIRQQLFANQIQSSLNVVDNEKDEEASEEFQ